MAAAILLLLLQPLALFSGCGGGKQQGEEEKVVNFTIESILIPRERDTVFILDWRRKSTGPGDVDPKELAQRYWKWEGGSLTEITREEYDDLASRREPGQPNKWIYGEHSITVLELDEGKGEAVVEIDSLYGPLAGSGTRYLLRKEGGDWTKVSEETVWVP